MSRVIAGPERRSRLISAEEKRTIAFHETGHALVGKSLEHCDPVHKITIVGRGMALGLDLSLRPEDRYLQSRAELGKAFRPASRWPRPGRKSSSSAPARAHHQRHFDDIRKATDLAHKMITEWGMSDR